MKKYITSIISVLCVFLWFTPWIFDSRAMILSYMISFAWFAFAAWIVLVVKTIKIIKCLEDKDLAWKHHLFSGGIIVFTYIVIIIAIANNYLLTA